MAGIFDDLLERQRQRFAAGAPALPAEPPARTDGWNLIPQPVDWDNVYAQALAEARSQDPTFGASYDALSADARQEMKLAVLGPVEGAISMEGLDLDELSRAFHESSYVTKVEGTTFTAWRNGELLIRLEHIDEAAENATATFAQMASVVVESVFLIIAVLLSAPNPSATAFNRAVQAIIRSVENSSSLQRAIQALDAARQVSNWELAKAVFGVILASNDVGIIGQTVHILLSEVAWYQYALMVLQILAYIAAAVLSGGAAVVAKIAVLLIQATQFILKVTNLQAITALAPAAA